VPERAYFKVQYTSISKAGKRSPDRIWRQT